MKTRFRRSQNAIMQSTLGATVTPFFLILLFYSNTVTKLQNTKVCDSRWRADSFITVWQNWCSYHILMEESSRQ